MGEMLSVKNINVYYGSIHAIKDVSFHVNEGEIVTLIGANGAGKTTTMHAISGLLKLQSGEIDYCGQTISKMEAHKIIRLGLAQVPEGRRVFSGLTVQQNLQMGAYTRRDGKEAIQNDFDMVFDLLPRLKERRNQPAGTLSGGEQQMLAMGRALMSNASMLMLDEPSMGLAPILVEQIFEIIQRSGDIPERDMYNTYNMGIGMILLVDPAQVDAVLDNLRAAGEDPVIVGKTVPGTGIVQYA